MIRHDRWFLDRHPPRRASAFMVDGRIVFSAVAFGNFNYDPWAIAVDGSGRTNLLSTAQVVERLPTWQ